MSKVRSTLLFVIFLSAVALSASQDAFAQWRISVNSPGYNMTCVRFLQDQNAREPNPIPNVLNPTPFHHGLFGGGDAGGTRGISYIRSSDPGWTAATVPNFWTDGWITDFAFEDTLTGYASIYGAAASFYGLPTVSGVMKTTDGGATWNFLTSAPPEVRGLFYDWTNQRLYCSSGGVDDIGGGSMSGAYVSADHGQTWTRINVPNPVNNTLAHWCYYTGFASWNGIDIVLATEGSPNPCTDAGFPPQNPAWLQSHDGGLTWSTAVMNQSSMQPVALKGTRTFFATSHPSLGSSAMFTSNDNGNVWNTVPGFSSNSNTDATECMGGDPCLLVAADSLMNGGVLFSIDDGGSWLPLTNGPATPVDLRFYVGSDSIWAYSKHTLQSVARPLPKPIHIFPNVINFAKSGCFTSDTIVQIFGCNCGKDTLIGDRLQWNTVGGTATDTAKFKISSNSSGAPWPAPPIPHLLCQNDLVHIQYTPNGVNPDVDTAHLIIHDGATVIDTPIVILGNGAPAGWIVNWPTNRIVNLFAKACEEIDTDLCFSNTTCSDDKITKIEITGQTGAVRITSPSLPIDPNGITLLARGGQQCIHVVGMSSDSGDYNVTITVTINGTGVPFNLHLGVKGKIPPYVTSFHIIEKYDCPHLGITDTAIYYWDTTCRSVKISNIKHINVTDFALDTSVVGRAQRGELYVYPQDSTGPGKTYYFKMIVKLLTHRPGPYTDIIEFIDSMSDGTFVHTFDTVSYQILNALSLKPAGPTSQGFGCISPCDSARVIFPLKIQNPCNFDVTISNYDETGKGLYTVTRHPTKGQMLKVGTSDTIIVEWPFGATTNPPNGYVLVTYLHGDAVSGYDSTTVRYDFSGTACPGINAVTLPANNTLGGVRFACDSIDVWDSTFNISCKTDAKISSITVLSGRNIVRSPNVGDPIPYGTSIPLHLRFVPLPGDTGQICGSIDLFVTDLAGQTGVDDTVFWCVNIIPTFPSLSVTSIAKLDSIACGGTWDTTICIKNTATCGKPIIITNAQQTSTGVTITGNFPVTIPPDSTFCFNAHFTPPTPTKPAGSIAGQINVTGDTNFVVPYNIPYQECSSGTVLRLDSTGKTTLSTPRCVILYDTMDIAMVAGTITVNSIVLNPTGGGYTLTSPGVPATLNAGDMLKFVVSFNPDLAPAGGPTSVVISYTQGGLPMTATIPINTLVTGKHYDVQLSLTSLDPKMISPHSTDVNSKKRFVVTALGDAIPASAGVTSVKIAMLYNTDMLTLLPTGGIALGLGWTSATPLPSDGTNDTLLFTLQPPAGGINPGDVIATITATAAIPKTDVTTMAVGPAAFNPSDTSFGRCIATAASDGSMVPVQLQLNCSDSILLISNQGNLSTVSNIEVIPNPAHKSNGSSAMLKFTSLVGADAMVDLLDLSGKTVAELSRGTLVKGDHALAIPTANLAEGTYFARIQIGGFTVVRKFVIEKE